MINGTNENSYSKAFGNSTPTRVEGETLVISTVSSVIGGSYDVGYEMVDEGRCLTSESFLRAG